ncbi:hypothetical protein [Fictibacillus gelatini]|uniref:hypothetical protein n=1 Tax=Fictibacillus gelatini TaxID=225985 RepID=UPI0003F73C7B|nr:hypothetical protein [Fictibacillus gelatini]
MLKGDTVRLKVHFKTFTGQSVDPTDVKLTIYKSDKTKIEEIPITDSNKENVGVYFYDYIVPDEILESFIFEFRGLYNNKPILARDSVQIKFTK